MSGGGDDYTVGFGKPPKGWQFPPGTSGNPRGRPRKTVSEAPVSLLDRPIAVREGGEVRKVHPKQLALMQQAKKALEEDDTAALLHLFDQFERYGLLDSIVPEQSGGGVLELSDRTMPFSMALYLATEFGTGPWTPAQIAKGRAHYIAERRPRKAQIDDEIGYPALEEKRA